MKKNVLFSKMALFGDSVEMLAEYLGITRQTLTQKIEGKSQFKTDEMKMIIKRYKLTPEEAHEIFLDEEDEEDEH